MSGYVMVDCGGLNIQTTSQTIAGLYNRLVNAINTGKEIVMVNCLNGTGVKASPIPAMANVSDTNIILTSFGKQFSVATTDVVTTSSAKSTK